MEPAKIAKQLIDFQKSTFDNSFNAMVMLQEQTERMVNMGLEHATWLPEEGRRVITEWIKAYKKGRDDFKNLVDENFKKVDGFFTRATQSQKAEKAQKPKTK
jgi:hypothetical protein